MSSILFTGARVVTTKGVIDADVRSENGTITHIGKNLPAADATHDVSQKLLFPGLIDCHVHFREPGYPEKATMESEMAAARIGGVTTVCEMPNTNPPTTTIAALADKVRRAELIPADIRFFFGVTQEAHLQALERLMTDGNEETQRLKARCCGVKIYLEHSTGNQRIEKELLDGVFALCAKTGLTLVAHCEDPATITALESKTFPVNISSHSLKRPPEAEAISIKEALSYARTHGTHFHVAHLSTADGLDLVRSAKKEGLSVTCEAAPHHLFMTTAFYKELGAYAKVNPPLREAIDRDALWGGIVDKTIDCVSTDHAPHTKKEKDAADPLTAPSGMPGVATMLPLLLSVVHGVWKHDAAPLAKLSYDDILRLTFTNPNHIFSLGRQEIAPGNKTPLVIVDPNVEWTVAAKNIPSLCGWTPYEGWILKGVVEEVLD